ncbi:MAG: FISUMP domain-containing protein [Bacteroidales bacterium]
MDKKENFFILVIILTLQIGLLFTPFGPIETFKIINKSTKFLEEHNIKYCLRCGNPVSSSKYNIIENGVPTGRSTTNNDYCSKHSPVTLKTSTNLFDDWHFSFLFFGLFIIASIITSVFYFINSIIYRLESNINLELISVFVIFYIVGYGMFWIKNDNWEYRVISEGSIDNIQKIITDYDGNRYNTINIGLQTWMVENLKVTHYRNGDKIPIVNNNKNWTKLKIGAYCNYNNDINSKYGLFYNFYAISDTHDICPQGWHIPSTKEWFDLIKYFDSQNLDSNIKYYKIDLELNRGFRDENGVIALESHSNYWSSNTDISDSTSLAIYFDLTRGRSYSTKKFLGFPLKLIKD